MAHGLFQPTAADTVACIREVFERGAKSSDRQNHSGSGYGRKYGVEARERGLKMLLGKHTTLGDLQRHVLIPAFDLDNEGRWAKSQSRTGCGSRNSSTTSRARIPTAICSYGRLAYSSSAPAYFPTAGGFVDGGLYANNPSMCALAQIFDENYAPDPKPRREEVLLLSIGAGQNLTFIEGDRNWGVFRWAPHFVDLTMDGTVGVADYQCRQMLLKNNYHRVARAFNRKITSSSTPSTESRN